MLQRFLDPKVLASISSLDLVAKTVVDGFVAGLHRSPTFGFSQEFAEYRQYVEGDDLRHVDWNVFARTERVYLKRFRGETNSQLLILLDTSASMGYTSGKITKLDCKGFEKGGPTTPLEKRSAIECAVTQLQPEKPAPTEPAAARPGAAPAAPPAATTPPGK